MQAYNFIYTDGKYMSFTLTDDEFINLLESLKNEELFFNTSAKCIIRLESLQFVAPVVEEKVEEEVDGTPPEWQAEAWLFNRSMQQNREQAGDDVDVDE